MTEPVQPPFVPLAVSLVRDDPGDAIWQAASLSYGYTDPPAFDQPLGLLPVVVIEALEEALHLRRRAYGEEL